MLEFNGAIAEDRTQILTQVLLSRGNGNGHGNGNGNGNGNGKRSPPSNKR